jgi:hypothetical protein
MPWLMASLLVPDLGPVLASADTKTRLPAYLHMPCRWRRTAYSRRRRVSSGTCNSFSIPFFFYTMEQAKLGASLAFSNWTLHMASIMIFSMLWGVALKE